VKIAVLYGGTSAERNVSLVSGRAVGLALEERGHDVLLVDSARVIDTLRPGEAPSFRIGAQPPEVLSGAGAALDAVRSQAVRDADIVFVMLHGGTGEDGTIQGLLALAGKAYTGSGVLSCALAMDKRIAKILFERAGVLTPAWRVVSTGNGSAQGTPDGSPALPGDIDPERAREAVHDLGGYPTVVKPNDQGSTVGLTVVGNESELGNALSLAGRYSDRVLVERFIPGREMTVAVLGGEALPVVEIAPASGLYDYESKYGSGRSEYTCPAPIPDGVSETLRSSALTAFAALGCTGYARIDYRLSPEGRGYCLEVNTVPGMTELSLVPMAAAAVGIGFGELVERIAAMASKRRGRTT
jgi:D-alanine-D-alanine ligase